MCKTLAFSCLLPMQTSLLEASPKSEKACGLLYCVVTIPRVLHVFSPCLICLPVRSGLLQHELIWVLCCWPLLIAKCPMLDSTDEENESPLPLQYTELLLCCRSVLTQYNPLAGEENVWESDKLLSVLANLCAFWTPAWTRFPETVGFPCDLHNPVLMHLLWLFLNKLEHRSSFPSVDFLLSTKIADAFVSEYWMVPLFECPFLLVSKNVGDAIVLVSWKALRLEPVLCRKPLVLTNEGNSEL